MNRLISFALVFLFASCEPLENREGQIATHVLSGEKYLVLHDFGHRVKVRTMDGDTETFYEEELLYNGKPLGPIYESGNPMPLPGDVGASFGEAVLENENGVFAERTWNPASGRYE